MTPSEVYTNVADHIENIGWFQGTRIRNGFNGSFRGVGHNTTCAMLGIHNLVGYADGRKTIKLFADFLGLDYSGEHDNIMTPTSAVVCWNNDPLTTRELVVKSLRAAAEFYEDK